MYVKKENDVKINKNCQQQQQQQQKNLQGVTTTIINAEAIQNDMMSDSSTFSAKSALKSTNVIMEANLSTTSTDSGVIIIDKNEQIFPNKYKRKNTKLNDNDQCTNDDNRNEYLGNIKNLRAEKLKQVSPAASLRSLSISIVSIDGNARDSSVVDSDFETELEGEKYVIHKLGEQTTFAPDSADVPQLHNGLKVVSQLVSPNADLPLQSEICTSKSNGPSHIGSIALSNSSDVTFGDKHFYEGPVTIQQFLIDSRTKQKEKAAYNNNAYEPDKASKSFPNDETTNFKTLPNDANNMWSCFGLQISRRVIYLTTIILAILTMASIVLYMVSASNLTSSSKQWGEGDDTRLIYPNVTNLDYTEIVTPNGTFRLIERDICAPRKPKEKSTYLKLPMPRVIIAHTASQPCHSDYSCILDVQIIQNFHMDTRNWSDIGYNFLIGSGGQVLVGRGWQVMGAHTLGYNRDSIGIAFIGTYISVPPTTKQLNALKLLMEWGVLQKYLAVNYRLYGARQLMATESPGTTLYKLIKTFEHWSEEL